MITIPVPQPENGVSSTQGRAKISADPAPDNADRTPIGAQTGPVSGTKGPLNLDRKLIACLRADLLNAQWGTEFLEEFFAAFEVGKANLNLDFAQAFSADQVALSRQRLAAEPDLPAAIITRLFLCGDKLSTRQLNQAFPQLRSAGLQRLGLVRPVNDQHTRWRGSVSLLPHQVQFNQEVYQWWIASDLPLSLRSQPLPPDFVLGIGGATLSLLQQTIRRPIQRAWDLGTGCGIQALYLSLHAREVLATDLSSRCLNFARFNALLAGNDAAGRPLSDRIRFQAGSFTDPAAGQRFDQIVSNPPYVITPPQLRKHGQLLEYRDGGRAGDAVMAFLATTLGSYLNPGGVAQMIGNWEISDPDQPFAHPLSWAQQAGKDLNFWVVLRETLSPARYANLWLQDQGITPGLGRKEHQVALGNWVNYFESRQVSQLGFGYLHFQRTDPSATYCLGETEGEGILPKEKTPEGEGIVSRKNSAQGEKAVPAEKSVWPAEESAWPEEKPARPAETLTQAAASAEKPLKSEGTDPSPDLALSRWALSSTGDTRLSQPQIWKVDARATPVVASGYAVEQILKNQRFLARNSSQVDLLSSRWQVASDLAEQRFYQPGAADPNAINLVQGDNWGLQIPVSAEVAGIVGACDGQLTLEEIIQAIAVLSGQSATVLTDLVLPQVAELIKLGCLIRPSDLSRPQA